jgi:hypothetical protein
MKFTVLAAAAAILGFQTIARADLITYTEEVTATGSLGSTSFTNALVTISFMGDTANVTSPSVGNFDNFPGVATLNIAGISGAATFTDKIGAFSNQSLNLAGISDFTSNLLIVDTNKLAFRNYGLTTDIGPVRGGASSNDGIAFATNMGDFVFTSIGRMSTFTAALTPVPEPVSYGFVGAGVVLLAAFQYRRRKRATA